MKKKSFLFMSLLAFCILLILNVKLIKICQKHTYQAFANISSYFIHEYPDKEVEIMDILIKNDSSYLEKYGVSSSLEELSIFKEMKREMIIITSLCFGVFLVFVYFLYFFFVHKMNKEVEEINNYLNEILKGSYEFHLSSYNEDELSILKNDIYKVTIQLKELKEYEKKEKKYLKNTLEDISHQLKTPLTALRLTNDILIEETLSEKEKQEFLHTQRKSLEKMEWLITTLLNMSKIDSGSVILKQEEVSAKELVRSSLETLGVCLELKEVEVSLQNLDFQMICDISWTREALTNILKNAYEHVLEKGHIEITGEDNPLYQMIQIKDNGQGISKKEINQIFTRFYGNKNNKDSVGIGLNMAKLVIEKQKGKIEVESKEKEYTIFKIIFPKKEV